MDRLPPVTPGELLDQEFLQPLGVSQYRLAKAIGVPASRISEIISGQRTITADTDLLITANDGWLAQHSRFDTLGRLWRKLAHHRIPVDLLLYSRSQVEERRHWLSHAIGRAYREGRVLHGKPFSLATTHPSSTTSPHSLSGFRIGEATPGPSCRWKTSRLLRCSSATTRSPSR